MKELGEGLAGPVLRGGASIVLDAVGEDEAHVLQELGGGGVLKLVNLVADGRQVHGLTDHIVVIRDLYTARKKQDTDVAKKRSPVTSVRGLIYRHSGKHTSAWGEIQAQCKGYFRDR